MKPLVRQKGIYTHSHKFPNITVLKSHLNTVSFLVQIISTPGSYIKCKLVKQRSYVTRVGKLKISISENG